MIFISWRFCINIYARQDATDVNLTFNTIKNGAR